MKCQGKEYRHSHKSLCSVHRNNITLLHCITCQSARCYNPEGPNTHLHHHEEFIALQSQTMASLKYLMFNC
jgi:hypothetical protein